MSQNEEKVNLANELAQERTDMASDRTRWAADRTLWADDRTLIAWVRTSLSLIGFGFGVGRALEYLEKFERETDPYHSAVIFGTSFIFLGILGLLGAILQHVRIARRLSKMGYHRVEPVPLGLLTAVILLIIGVFAFVMVLVNP